MSITSGQHKYDLPPNVRGKQRGTLKLTILEIVPKSPSVSSVLSGATTTATTITTTTSFSLSGSNFSGTNSKGRNPISTIGSGGVSVKLIWWGQSHENSASVNYNPVQKPAKANPESHSVEYSIKTSSNLFQNYLSNCEPVEVKLTSNTSNLQIGTGFMRISKSLIENCSKGNAELTETVKIFSPRNIVLGEIRLKFKMMFLLRPESRLSVHDATERKLLSALEKENELHIPSLDSSRSCKSLKSDINNYISQTRQKTSRPTTAASNNSLSYRALDYLTGREMSEGEQLKALEEIQNSSPLESVVAELTNRLKIPAGDVYKRIDSLRLSIQSITILPAGMRELQCSQLDDRTFTVESHISPNLLSNVRAKYDYDVMRFYSDYVDGKERRIDFNRDAIRSIKISEYVDNAYIRFTIWSRSFGSKYSRCFGTTKFPFSSILDAGELEQIRKLTIKSCTDKTCVGSMMIKVTLGTKGVHFGEDLMTIIQSARLHQSPPTSNRSRKCNSHRPASPIFDKSSISCRKCNNTDPNKMPNTPSSTCDSTTDRSNKSQRQTKSDSKGETSSRNENTNFDSNREDESRQTVSKESSDSSNDQRLLQGLLYVGSMRNIRELQNGGYFLVCRAFWKEDATSTEFCQDNNFNFLETFPIINNEAFRERTRNNHLDLELWQKFADNPEQMVGIVKLPLHQFFIAFRDNMITSHLCQAKLPVISIDGWVTVSSPLSAESCGQLQTLLAIGTEEQLEYLKTSRGLCLNRVYDSLLLSDPLQHRLPVPQNVPTTKPNERSLSSCDAESQTNFNDNSQEMNPESSGRRERLSDLLGSFIDSLAQKLPANNAGQTAETSAATSNNHETETNQSMQGSQMRKTSDLLDVLQKALVTPPAQNLDGITNASLFKLPTISSVDTNIFRPRFVKILLEIENALHLPKNPMKMGNKKMLKRNNSAAKCKQSRLTTDEEPSAYVTFQAEEGSGQMIKSHEGMVYVTHVIEKCCNPVWNRRFEIYVQADLMKNDEKRFILKVWRKRVTDLAQCRLLPTPLEDAIIGFAAVDLNVLLAGMPCIAGWFNIVDFNGRINGQIKVNVRPLEDVLKFKDTVPVPIPVLNKSSILDSAGVPSNVMKPAQPAVGADMNNSILSRAIKRKFTELEEITDRLRARLLDVTGSPEVAVAMNSDVVPDSDPIDDQLDEFERDLNTACNEDSNEEEPMDNFGWLGNATIASDHDSSDISANGSQERIQMIAECLRKTNLNYEVENNRPQTHRKERNPPEGETASSSDKKHAD